jgi:hypothetical protein
MTVSKRLITSQFSGPRLALLALGPLTAGVRRTHCWNAK